MPLNDWKLPDVDGYEGHRLMVEAARRQTNATRAKPKNPKPRPKRRRKPGPRKKRKKYVSKKMKQKAALLATFTTGELRGEVSRRNNRKRYLDMTPEQRQAEKQQRREHMQAVNRLMRENCPHPNPREGKKRKRQLYCPRCKGWIPKPTKEKPQPKYEVIK